MTMRALVSSSQVAEVVKEYIGETLPTAFIFAFMRLLTRMCANMYGQCASLYKALNTAHMNAAVWSFVRVYPVMSLKVGFAVETLLKMQSASVNWNYVEYIKRHMPEIRLPSDSPLARSR